MKPSTGEQYYIWKPSSDRKKMKMLITPPRVEVSSCHLKWDNWAPKEAFYIK